MGRRPPWPVVPVLLAAATAGCAALLPATGGGRGLPEFEGELRRDLAAGRFEEALEGLSAGRSPVADSLLRLQYRGLVAHYGGRPEASSRALEAAAALAEERYTRSISRGALALVTNDRVLPYRPADVERLLLHYYGALNYLAADDPEEAAVEARRLAHRLDRIRDESPGWAQSGAGRSLRAVLRRFSGAVFEVAGEENDASVAYRLADRIEGADSEGRRPRVDSAAGRPAETPPERGGEVVLLLEQGFAPHRIERSVNAVLGRPRLRRLRREAAALRTVGDRPRGSAVGTPDARSDSSALSLTLARELLEGASRSGRRVRLGGDDAGDDDGLRVLRVAWPELAEPVAARSVRGVRSDPAVAAPGRVREAGGDLAGALSAEFRSGQPLRLARTLLRAAVKQAAVEAVADGVGDEDEGWGDLVGTAASVFAAAVERADTRSWHLLPARLSLIRLSLPPGEHHLTVQLGAGGPGGARRLEVGPVTVAGDRPTVISRRVWPRRGRFASQGRK